MVRERNKEIEAIIEKLGDETHSTQKSLMASYEKKVAKIEEKHREELNDYKKLLDNTKDKLLNETQTREMLDENLRVLTRRINDLEIELSDKKEKVGKLERAAAHSQAQLDAVYDRQQKAKNDLDIQWRERLQERESEIRRLKEEAVGVNLKHDTNLDQLKAQQRVELETIQSKVAAAMEKKKEIIESLSEEIRMRDLQINKLKQVMDKQRQEMLLNQ